MKKCSVFNADSENNLELSLFSWYSIDLSDIYSVKAPLHSTW